MQRELSELEARGDRLTHYELLGVTADADGGDIRRAYLEKSKRFHPDAWYRKDLGPYAAILSKWFQKLAAGYQVLSDEDERAAYDREIKARLSANDRAAVEKRQLSRAEEERRERERRERLLRTKGFARVGAARKLYEEAAERAAKGERAQAIAALRYARELDPNRKEIQQRLLELEREQARARARLNVAAAQEDETQERFAKAAMGYIAAFQSDPANFDAAFGAARCSLKSNEPQHAATWAARAIELKGDAEVRLVLARAYAAMNQRVRARNELQVLLASTPDHKEARALLRSL